MQNARHAARFAAAASALLALVSVTVAGASVPEAVRTARSECHGSVAPLVASAALDAVARAIATGQSLEEALTAAGYHAQEATALPVSGADSDRTMASALRAEYCAELRDSSAGELGVASRDGETWLVLAQPLRVPAEAEAARIRDEVLALINAARSEPRRCGAHYYEAAPPLTLSDALSSAARSHAQTMARTGTFDHVDDEGRTPSERVRSAHYRARLVGENIAAGMGTAAEAVEGWLASPGHCENVMDPRFTELGAAYATNLGRDPAVYWTLDLAAPREERAPAAYAASRPLPKPVASLPTPTLVASR